MSVMFLMVAISSMCNMVFDPISYDARSNLLKDSKKRFLCFQGEGVESEHLICN